MPVFMTLLNAHVALDRGFSQPGNIRSAPVVDLSTAQERSQAQFHTYIAVRHRRCSNFLRLL